jgi:hypothetical protein
MTRRGRKVACTVFALQRSLPNPQASPQTSTVWCAGDDRPLICGRSSGSIPVARKRRIFAPGGQSRTVCGLPPLQPYVRRDQAARILDRSEPQFPSPRRRDLFQFFRCGCAGVLDRGRTRRRTRAVKCFQDRPPICWGSTKTLTCNLSTYLKNCWFAAIGPGIP